MGRERSAEGADQCSLAETEECWRIESRVKINSVGLNLCLHLGIQPPDTFRPLDCAKIESWIDTSTFPIAQRASEAIGAKLQANYESMQPKAKYKLLIDPSVDDIKKQFTSLRKHSKHDRVLFHYLGHGVPKPTLNGEIWVFNKVYTQYIPLSIYDIDLLLERPAFYIFDMPYCKNVLEHLNTFACGSAIGGNNASYPLMYIASTSQNVPLPLNQNIPMDLLTSCLVSPIEMSVYWFLMVFQLTHIQKQWTNLTPLEIVNSIPGKLTDRKSPLGCLNWIYTCIMDNIAWETLPRRLFKQLYREDMLLASLFRNYLLADKVMRHFGLEPTSFPAIPTACSHPLWNQWLSVLEEYVQFAFKIAAGGAAEFEVFFFDDHLVNLQILCQTDPRKCKREIIGSLPILLQILLSQSNRIPALEILCMLFESDKEFIEQSLQIGIFPYLLKLVQSCSMETRILMARIWTQLFVHYPSTKVDFEREKCLHCYFEVLLDDKAVKTRQISHILVLLHEFMQGNNSNAGIKSCLSEGILDALERIMKQKLYLSECLLLVETLQNHDFTAFLELFPALRSCIVEIMRFNEANTRLLGVAFASSTLKHLVSLYLVDSAEFLQFFPLEAYLECAFDTSPTVRNEVLRSLFPVFSACCSKLARSASLYLGEEECIPVEVSICDVLWKLIVVLSEDYDLHVSKTANFLVQRIVQELKSTSSSADDSPSAITHLLRGISFCEESSDCTCTGETLKIDPFPPISRLFLQCWHFEGQKQFTQDSFPFPFIKYFIHPYKPLICGIVAGENTTFSHYNYTTKAFEQQFQFPKAPFIQQIVYINEQIVAAVTTDDYLLFFNSSAFESPYFAFKITLNSFCLTAFSNEYFCLQTDFDLTVLSLQDQSEIFSHSSAQIKIQALAITKQTNQLHWINEQFQYFWTDLCTEEQTIHKAQLPIPTQSTLIEGYYQEQTRQLYVGTEIGIYKFDLQQNAPNHPQSTHPLNPIKGELIVKDAGIVKFSPSSHLLISLNDAGEVEVDDFEGNLLHSLPIESLDRVEIGHFTPAVFFWNESVQPEQCIVLEGVQSKK